jgi:four helix bundle protein
VCSRGEYLLHWHTELPPVCGDLRFLISDLRSQIRTNQIRDRKSSNLKSKIKNFVRNSLFPVHTLKNQSPDIMNRHELQERLINFSVLVVKLTETMPKTYTGKHFGQQLLRSGSSPALHYGESQSAESKKDFIHKMSLVLKELRESYVNLIIIKRAGFHKNGAIISEAIKMS